MVVAGIKHDAQIAKYFQFSRQWKINAAEEERKRSYGSGQKEEKVAINSI